MWVWTKRNYHGEEPENLIRWVVHQEGVLRGICECWNEADAVRLVGLLNNDD